MLDRSVEWEKEKKQSRNPTRKRAKHKPTHKSSDEMDATD